MEMVEKKTAILYAASCKIGAILGGGTPEEAQALWDFGRLTGVGFQIYDDVLDLITAEEVLGKVTPGIIM
jgi:geranylgeranyl diphosphate synthase type I